MPRLLPKYKKLVGEDAVQQLHAKARKFSNKHIVAISSTYYGGGVAEMLNSLVVIFHELNIDFGWRILHGNPEFFNVTKQIHNAIQGAPLPLSTKQKKLHLETNERFSYFTHLHHHDIVIVHDPQPLPIIKFYPQRKGRGQKWIFRGHIDFSRPNPQVWNYLAKYIKQYDHVAVSKEEYIHPLGVPQSIIHPAVDAFSPKNEHLGPAAIRAHLKKYGFNHRLPLISQISRFDPWKDPFGVVKIFETVHQKIPCQLALVGSLATDDPEGQRLFEKLQKQVAGCPYQHDIRLILDAPDSAVNALQRASSVVIQKSLKEGFGLTVSEALFKGTPVVASRVGGIPLQVLDGENGFLHEPDDIDGFAGSIVRILQDQKLAARLGREGKRHITERFLITRLVDDWLDLFAKLL